MIYTESLFLGVTPTGARNFVASKVASLKKPFFNACAGRFSIVEAAIKGGVPPQDIHDSDIGLFSSIIGFLADTSKKLDDLDIRILDPVLEPKGIANDLDFAAHVMLILKLNQMKQTNLRGLYLREELLSSWNRSREKMKQQLEALVKNIAGIHYEIADIWDVISRVSQEDVVFYASVPHYARGYEKMFSASNLKWNEPAIPQFDPKRFPEVILPAIGPAGCWAGRRRSTPSRAGLPSTSRAPASLERSWLRLLPLDLGPEQSAFEQRRVSR